MCPEKSCHSTVMNLRSRYREFLRLFAAAIKAKSVSEWFEIDRPIPYVLLVADGKKTREFRWHK